jgi:hypothetical protein
MAAASATEAELAARLAAYKRDGYTIWPALYSEESMAKWRAEQTRLQAESVTVPGATGETLWFGNMLERSPQLMWEAVANPTVLDFAETVVGPFVQLDNLTLAAMAPVPDPEDARGKAGGWHRDRWGRMPNGAYERPLAFNAITYLQDLTDDNVRSAPFPCPTLNLATLTRRQPLRSLRCVPLAHTAPLAHATSAGCMRRAHCASCPGATCSPLSWDRRKARPRIATSRSST